MSEEKSVVSELVGQTSGVLEKAYDDLAHPTAKSVGNTVSLIPRTIGVWLGKWEKWVINGEESIRLTAEAVREKAAKIPEEKLTEPEPYVAIPAVQQLSYCYDSEELRNMYANLLVSSMNEDTKMNVHPGFTSIINQLSPLDVKVLEYIISSGGAVTTVTMRLMFKNHSFMVPVTDYSIELKEILDDTSLQSATLQNLKRLGLVNISYDRYLKPVERYEAYLIDSVYLEQERNAVEGKHIELVKGFVELSAFGIAFCNVCCD